ncbi:hypothetical protein CONLIGDRAFT_368097 [Coniochaeta ligniaria NRRL 30616]|uniref:Uncharacterized protein n=1 Tax=Coniochaeta ligniaria NRRL 30616 TaxID=1408157 RepID=A0A1J7I3T2_9PEZI|nr:hypothetical protein CONLIGDRAFT_368097 [Coniochaeta ligniaria NRRL 30616]
MSTGHSIPWRRRGGQNYPVTSDSGIMRKTPGRQDTPWSLDCQQRVLKPSNELHREARVSRVWVEATCRRYGEGCSIHSANKLTMNLSTGCAAQKTCTVFTKMQRYRYDTECSVTHRYGHLEKAHRAVSRRLHAGTSGQHRAVAARSPGTSCEFFSYVERKVGGCYSTCSQNTDTERLPLT